MARKTGSKAFIPNPALKPLEVLIGDWQTSGSHPYLPNTTLLGRVSFEWLEGGAFLIMRSEIDNPKFPDGVRFLAVTMLPKNFLCFTLMNVALQGNTTCQ